MKQAQLLSFNSDYEREIKRNPVCYVEDCRQTIERLNALNASQGHVVAPALRRM